MTPERFADLTEAYGADLRRWPASEQAGAQALLARDPGVAEALGDAARLDLVLSAYATPAPSAALRRAVLESAPRSNAMRRRFTLWWAAGTTTVGAAGAVLGAALILVSPPQTREPGAGWIYDQATAFGDLNPGQDS
jgi:hypothetical protein